MVAYRKRSVARTVVRRLRIERAGKPALDQDGKILALELAFIRRYAQVRGIRVERAAHQPAVRRRLGKHGHFFAVCLLRPAHVNRAVLHKVDVAQVLADDVLLVHVLLLQFGNEINRHRAVALALLSVATFVKHIILAERNAVAVQNPFQPQVDLIVAGLLVVCHFPGRKHFVHGIDEQHEVSAAQQVLVELVQFLVGKGALWPVDDDARQVRRDVVGAQVEQLERIAVLEQFCERGRSVLVVGGIPLAVSPDIADLHGF